MRCGQGSLNRRSSPVGTTGCSQGRQPLVGTRKTLEAPEGRQELSDTRFDRHLRTATGPRIEMGR
jgi:hypothetical protein